MNMSQGLANHRELLLDRGAMLASVRSFFAQRNVLEVDCPALSRFASIDPHIDLIEAKVCQKREFLFTSPEYPMKRLLAEGSGDIYQLSHVFRDEEQGWQHMPEFMMLEWYRLGFGLEELIEETVALTQLFISNQQRKYQKLSYQDAFLNYAAIDPFRVSEPELQAAVDGEAPKGDKEALLDLVWAMKVEPHLGINAFTTIIDFPPHMAALAQIGANNMAQRFELYIDGREVANGYQELVDRIEQEKRLKKANEQRKELGKNVLPHDPYFLKALTRGIPDCAGVAVGFDRLMMLRHNKSDIRAVVPIAWDTR